MMVIKKTSLDAGASLSTHATGARLRKKSARRRGEAPVSIPISTKSLSKVPRKRRVKRVRFAKHKLLSGTQVTVQESAPRTTVFTAISQNAQLAVLSPFRFPIDHTQLASNVARITGTLFVVVGAIFTLLNMQLVFGGNTPPQLAQTACIDGLLSTGELCTTSGSSGSSGISEPVNETPEVDVRFDGTEPYANIIPVNVYVSRATEVVLVPYFKTESRYLPPLTMISSGDGVWRHYWDTRNAGDGEYRMKVRVTNQYGTYYHETELLDVLNHPLGTSDFEGETQNTNTSSGNPTTTTTGVAESPLSTATTSPVASRVTLRIGQASPITGSVRLTVTTADATQVKLYARQLSTSVNHFLGNATFHGDDEWRFEWNTNNFIDGLYELKAQAVFGNTSITSSLVSTTIKNTALIASSTTPPATLTTTAQPLEPQIAIEIPKESPVSGTVDILIGILGAHYMELYAVRKDTLIDTYLGLAQQVNETEWRFPWQTSQLPNGRYEVYVKVRHVNGFSLSRRYSVLIENPPQYTHSEEQKQMIDNLRDVVETLEATTRAEGEELEEADTGQERTLPPIVHVTPLVDIVNTSELSGEDREKLTRILLNYREQIHEDLDRFSQAVRLEDEKQMSDIRDHIEQVRAEVVNTLPFSRESTELIAKIDEHLKKVTLELIELMIRNERVIKERLGDAVFEDSDADGASNYDEVTLYGTDPFSADTDSDGFIDGTEIMLGYDPQDSNGQTTVAYESPRETGIVRTDILSVSSIASLPENIDEAVDDGVRASAVITGRGLPNSYVTLYIYSTPIIVTVKTDKDGSWSYIFDKELDDGEHEVYVGMTDNAGRMIAKSSPLKFIKTAEAFTPVDAAQNVPSTAVAHGPSLLDQHVMLIVASIAVVGLGLVLILLGLYTSGSRRVIASLHEPTTA